MKKDEQLGTLPIGKLLLQQSIPAGLGILVLSIYTLVDTFFIGNYVGGIGIAAVTIVSPITFLVSSLGLGVGMGGGSLISIALGKEEIGKAKRIFGNQIFLVMVFSIIVLGAGFGFYDGILQGFGASENTLAASQEYFFYILIGLPLYMAQMMLNNVLRAEGKPIGAMAVLLAPAILNIGLDAWMIAGMGMGLTGAALATAISQGLGVLVGIGLIFFGKSRVRASLQDLIPHGSTIAAIAKLGSVQFFAQGSMSIVVVIANNMLMKYGGDLAISAYGLVIRIMMFAFFPVMGIVQGFMPIAGFNFGAGKMERVEKAIKIAFRTSNIIAFLTMVVGIAFREPILRLFTDETELIQLSSVVMIWALSAFPLLGLQQVSTSYFQAIGKAAPALWLTLTKQFILIPALFLLPIWFSLEGIWYTFPVSEVTTTIIAFWYFKRELKIQKQTQNKTQYELANQKN